MTIKKSFQPLISLLQSNQDSVVSDILDQAISLATAKNRAGGGDNEREAATYRDPDTNEVVLLRCYYFKKWLPVDLIAFGPRNGGTGYNSMCRLGVNLWTKRNNEYKKAKSQLLDDVANGTIAPTDLSDHLARVEEANQAVEDFPLPELAFDSVEAYLEADIDDLIEAAEEYARGDKDAQRLINDRLHAELEEVSEAA